jgi:BirA family transcriptional regulator, biotin operon repressor / biotin---[acetyl-CoA-carboxylase] ligase
VDRRPLDHAVLAGRLPAPWTSITIVDELDSTNRALLVDPVGYPPGAVLVAEHQSAGRGRLDRTWVSPPRSALTFSVALRPAGQATRWGWLPLLTGVALCDAVRSATGLAVVLKWPNDLLAAPNGGKLAGILAQTTGDRVVVGVGLNVSTTAPELPVATATSLELTGATPVERTELLRAILAELGSGYLQWQSLGGDASACGLAAAYRARCATLGRSVTVTGLDGSVRAGRASGIDSDGCLLLDVPGGREVIAAGDVEHVQAVGHRTLPPPAVDCG